MNGHIPGVFDRRLKSRRRPPMGKNSGSCRGCGSASTWRSVYDLCWPCEMERIKARPPLRIDSETFNGTPPLSYVFNPF